MRVTCAAIFGVLLPGLMSVPAFSQADFTGQWESLYHEDAPERLPGPELGDAVKLPFGVHPVTGRKALYAVSGSSYGIVAMPEDEALALLDELAAHATQPQYQLSYPYRVGDVVIWDNASLLHSATLTDPNDPRTLWRITIREPTTRLDALDVLARTYAQGPV